MRLRFPELYTAMTPLKILMLSRNYPNNAMALLGVWVEGLVRALAQTCEVRVIAPVPYCPPLPSFVEYSRFRHIIPQQRLNGIEVLHPRFLTGPGYSTHGIDASTYYWGIRGLVDQLRQKFPFDLIHAHFSYPDGVVAARLGERYGVPVVITEHARWRPWMDQYPRVRRQAVWASKVSMSHIAVSHYVRDMIVQFVGESNKVRVVPLGVDGSTFVPLPPERKPDPNQILYVGRLHLIKGVDVLLRAMRRLVDGRPETRLVLIGGNFYRHTLPEVDCIRALSHELRLEQHVTFIGPKAPDEVARMMAESALVVLPSRSETFGTVLVEALACGTPVVATRCGGPEDIVNAEVGVLVPKEDPEALAAALGHVLEHRETYNPAKLRAYTLANFSWERVASQITDCYQEAHERFRAHIHRTEGRV
jgi:glycosyltransferase involved in cell wall biosynthesis